MIKKVDEGTALDLPPDAPAPAPGNPASGGSYVRDPATGELELVTPPPKPAPKKQTSQE